MGDRYISGDPPSKEEKIQLRLEQLESDPWLRTDQGRDPDSIASVKTIPTEDDYAHCKEHWGYSREHIDAIRMCRIPRGPETYINQYGVEVKNVDPGYNFGRVLGNASASACGGGLVLWITNELGERVFCIAKPDQIRPGHGKYEIPAGFTDFIPLHFAYRFQELVRAGDKPIVVTESPWKAEALAQHGYPAIGFVTGVFGGMKPRSKTILHRDFLRVLPFLKKHAARIAICFDSDAASNDQVETAEKRLAKALRKQLLATAVVRLPDKASDPDDYLGEKVGIDDFMKQVGGPEEFPALLAKAFKDPDVLPSVYEKDIKELVEAFLDYLEESGRPLLYGYAESFWLWSLMHNRYQQIKDDKLGHQITAWLLDNFTDVRRSVKLEIIDMLKAIRRIRLPDDVKPPCFIGEVSENHRGLPISEYVVTKDMLIHVPTKTTHKIGPDVFVVTSLGTHWDPDAKCPTWDKCVRQWSAGDETFELSLQEIGGYCLTSDNRHETAFLLWGQSGSGKGTFFETATAVYGGDDAVCEVDFLSLGTRFGRAPLVDKSVVVISELDLPDRPDDKLKRSLEVFKKITGNDRIPLEKKGIDPYSCHVPVRIMISSNELPILPDSAGALRRRLKVLHFQHVVKNVDINLKKQLLTELPGILNWMIEGYLRLLKNDKFTVAAYAEGGGMSDLDLIGDLGAPMKTFVDETFDLGPELMVPTHDAFFRYQDWCRANDERPKDRRSFIKDLKSAFQSLAFGRVRINGVKTYVIMGIALKRDPRPDHIPISSKGVPHSNGITHKYA